MLMFLLACSKSSKEISFFIFLVDFLGDKVRDLYRGRVKTVLSCSLFLFLRYIYDCFLERKDGLKVQLLRSSIIRSCFFKNYFLFLSCNLCKSIHYHISFRLMYPPSTIILSIFFFSGWKGHTNLFRFYASSFSLFNFSLVY